MSSIQRLFQLRTFQTTIMASDHAYKVLYSFFFSRFGRMAPYPGPKHHSDSLHIKQYGDRPHQSPIQTTPNKKTFTNSFASRPRDGRLQGKKKLKTLRFYEHSEFLLTVRIQYKHVAAVDLYFHCNPRLVEAKSSMLVPFEDGHANKQNIKT